MRHNAVQQVVTESGKQLAAGSYSETGIQIASLSGFSPYYTGAYIVSVFAGDDDEQSAANVRRYYYKGDTVAEFDYGSTKFANNIAADSLSISAKGGHGHSRDVPRWRNCGNACLRLGLRRKG